MKTITTLFPGIFIFGAFVAIFAGVSMVHEDLGIFGWSILVIGVLVIAWVIAALLNVAIFAPVYWLLGRTASKKRQTEKPQDRDA